MGGGRLSRVLSKLIPMAPSILLMPMEVLEVLHAPLIVLLVRGVNLFLVSRTLSLLSACGA
jgi:hypothetical protein